MHNILEKKRKTQIKSKHVERHTCLRSGGREGMDFGFNSVADVWHLPFSLPLLLLWQLVWLPLWLPLLQSSSSVDAQGSPPSSSS